METRVLKKVPMWNGDSGYGNALVGTRHGRRELFKWDTQRRLRLYHHGPDCPSRRNGRRPSRRLPFPSGWTIWPVMVKA